ncbi:hypothetical protein JTE90_015192 [Oedothorax gibbosus]|uniref:Uncharacterized protein n=1 Tax=Oedothorax gibbosus TaxID=931172 RepID=A0AAV6V8K0_9ARAC|nr:hypothetical protein JTE90_015192 [Oedothorax gibbosus]
MIPGCYFVRKLDNSVSSPLMCVQDQAPPHSSNYPIRKLPPKDKGTSHFSQEAAHGINFAFEEESSQLKDSRDVDEQHAMFFFPYYIKCGPK